MRFVNSLTRTPSELRLVTEAWQASGDPRHPFQDLLVTPLTLSARTVDLVRSVQARFGSRIHFDSGGFYVQIGRLTYDDLYPRLLRAYHAHDWASRFVLPDWVPVAVDSLDDVWQKVRHTIWTCDRFLREAPAYVRERAVGVIHGRTLAQIEYSLKGYLDLGVRFVGFGSFPNGGKDSSVNILSRASAALLKTAVRLAHAYGTTVHTFGIGSPAALPVLAGLGVDSFDSISWMKSAGFGNVFVPLGRPLNVTYRDYGAATVTETEFRRLCGLAGHTCRFCVSFAMLRRSRTARMMHNLTCLLDSLDLLRDRPRALEVFGQVAPGLARRWRLDEETT